ncbi:MAG TPA: hypothetical protein IAD13_05030 [Bacteroidetes bacterium]|nr:hypothetical protein [Candidatus Limimorpha avicola]
MGNVVEIISVIAVFGLPAFIVAIIMKVKNNKIKAQEKVLLKSIEMGQPVNIDMFLDEQNRKYEKGGLKLTLLRKIQSGIACFLIGLLLLVLCLIGKVSFNETIIFMLSFVFLSLGVAFIVSFFIGRKMMAKELAENELDTKELAEKPE